MCGATVLFQTAALPVARLGPGRGTAPGLDLADSALDQAAADRPLDSDLTAAEAVLPVSPPSRPGPA